MAFIIVKESQLEQTTLIAVKNIVAVTRPPKKDGEPEIVRIRVFDGLQVFPVDVVTPYDIIINQLRARNIEVIEPVAPKEGKENATA